MSEIHTLFWLEYLKGRDHFEDLGIGGESSGVKSNLEYRKIDIHMYKLSKLQKISTLMSGNAYL